MVATESDEPVLVWPARSDGRTPGPFPEDGFYAEDMESHERAAALVRDLVHQMATATVETYILQDEDNDGIPETPYQRPVLDCFVSAPLDGNLAGRSSFENFIPEGTFPAPSEITSANYVDVFNLYCYSLLRKMDTMLFWAYPAQLDDITDDTEGASGAVVRETCQEAKEDALALYQLGVGSAVGFIFMDERVTRQATDSYNAKITSLRDRFTCDLSKVMGKVTPFVIIRSDNHVAGNYVNKPEDPIGGGDMPLDQYRPAGSLSGSNGGGQWLSSEVYGLEPTDPNSTVSFNVNCPAGVGASEINQWQMHCHLAITGYAWKHQIDIPLYLDDCPTCFSCTTASLDSINYSIGLGADEDGPAGSLVIWSEQPSPALSDPQSLIRNFHGNVFSLREFVDVGGGEIDIHVRQIVSPQQLIDIETVSPYLYRLHFYDTANFGVFDDQTGFFAADGTSFRTITVENPDASPTTFNRLRISEDSGGSVKVTEYAFDATSDTWTLTTGAGADQRTETLQSIALGNQRVEIRTVTGNGEVAFRQKDTYRVFPWNNPLSMVEEDREELVESVRDPGGVNRVTAYTYYSDASSDGTNYGNLKTVSYPDGSWVRYEYDGEGLVTKMIQPFQDAGPEAPEASCRVTNTTRTTISDLDGDGAGESLVTQWVKEPSNSGSLEVTRSYILNYTGLVTIDLVDYQRTREIDCLVPGASYDAASNLATDYYYIDSGEFAGELGYLRYPNGTLLANTYERAPTGELVITRKEGQPNGAFDDVVDGYETETMLNEAGEILTQLVTDIASGVLIESMIFTNTDARKRVTGWTYLDGTQRSLGYGCCNLDWVDDRQGTRTSYYYDSLDRLDYESRIGIETHYTYNARDQITEIRRRGTDSSEIVVSQYKYNLAGERQWAQDGAGDTTFYAHTLSGGNKLTATLEFPNGGERSEVFYRDGAAESLSGDGVFPMKYDYGVAADTHDGMSFNARTIKRIWLGDAGEETEWETEYRDMLGRVYKMEYPDASGSGSVYAYYYYNSLGQLESQSDPDGVTIRYGYNDKGERTEVVQDANPSAGSIDYADKDRIIQSERTYIPDATSGVGDIMRTTVRAWTTDDVDTSEIIAQTDVAVDGLTLWRRVYDSEVQTTVVNDGSGQQTVTTQNTGGSTLTAIYQDERLASESWSGSRGSIIYGYDAHGRLQTLTDARNGATTFTYYGDDQLATVTTPAADAQNSPQVTTFYYNGLGQPNRIILPDTSETFRNYYPNGLLKREHGSQTYPVEFEYDSQGRLRYQHTWQSFLTNEGKATTEWRYNPYRGWLDEKRYDVVNDTTFTAGPLYSYTPGSRLQTRQWARDGGSGRLTVTYNYDFAANHLTGDLVGLDYEDLGDGWDTDVVYSYDRQGRPKTVQDASGNRTLGYYHGILDTETYTSGPLAGMALDRAFDSHDRYEGLLVSKSGSPIYRSAYGYEAGTGRLQTVEHRDPTTQTMLDRFTYAYHADSDLVHTITSRHDAVDAMQVIKTWDKLNRLDAITTNNGGGSVQRSFDYAYNALNQREAAELESGDKWTYGYDDLGQVNSVKKLTSGDEAIPGYTFGFEYDDIGNRRSVTRNERNPVKYVANALNQYDQQAVERVVDILGTASPEATVRVNDLEAVREGNYFHAAIDRQPSANFDYANEQDDAEWLEVNVEATITTEGSEAASESTGFVFLPEHPLVPLYDEDGNLEQDSEWIYRWNSENRLMEVETAPVAWQTGAPRILCEFDYDSIGRRFKQTVSTWDGANYSSPETVFYLYDGWNPLMRYALADSADPQTAITASQSYYWGADLSGSMQGAGGVGGLLMVADDAQGEFYPVYDGNGNIIAYADATDGNLVAAFEYGPFGETIVEQFFDEAARTALGGSGRFGFSTKMTDLNTGLIYYGYRYLNDGRWLNRDPLQEIGGLNLYAFVGNEGINAVDPLGLLTFDDGKSFIGNVGDYAGAYYSGLGEGGVNIAEGFRGAAEGIGETAAVVFDPVTRNLVVNDVKALGQALRENPALAKEIAKELGVEAVDTLNDPDKLAEFIADASAGGALACVTGQGATSALQRLIKLIPDDTLKAANKLSNISKAIPAEDLRTLQVAHQHSLGKIPTSDIHKLMTRSRTGTEATSQRVFKFTRDGDQVRVQITEVPLGPTKNTPINVLDETIPASQSPIPIGPGEDPFVHILAR